MHKSPVVDSMSVVLTGSGGAGVMTAGETLLDAAQRCGLYGLMTRSSGPQIRGGEAAALLRLATYPVESHADRFDILLALDFENSQRFAAEIPLDRGSLIVADSGAGEAPPALAAYGARLAFTEIADMAKTIKGGRVSMIALGIIAALIDMPQDALLAASQAAVRMGANAAKAVITWGSSTQPVREAVKLARSKGLSVKLIAMRLIAPAQPEKLREELAGVRRILVIEQSHQGQFWRYLSAHYGLGADVIPIHRPGPLPIRPGEILSSLVKEAHA